MKNSKIVAKTNKGISLSLPISVINLIDKVKEQRQDPTRSDTVRTLLLEALGRLSYLSDKTKKAFGMNKRS